MTPTVALRISAGALIPSIGAIVFNIVNFVFENYGKTSTTTLADSVYDFGIGCLFSLFGIGAATKNADFGKKVFVLFAGLLLVQILVDFIAPALWGSNKLRMIWISNILSLFALCWALLRAE